MSNPKPFDDLVNLLEQLPEIDACAVKKVTDSTLENVMYHSDIKELYSWLAGWQGTKLPNVQEAHICVLASSYLGGKQEEVQSFIEDASKGKAKVNALCVPNGIGLRVLEMAPEIPHKIKNNWTESECMAAVAFGMEASASGGSLLGLSDVAPGGEANSLAIISKVLYNDAVGVLRKASSENTQLIQDAISFIDEVQASSPLDLLLELGGREIAAAIGAVIAARSRRLPILAEGWAVLTAVCVLEKLMVGSTDHVKFAAAQNSVQLSIMKFLGKDPLLNVVINEGAGCSVALGHSILKASVDLA